MRAKLLISAVATLAALTPALADEGMWTFDNFPSQAVKQKYGVTIDQAWLDRVRAGAVRLAGGCSASLVSSEGLVLTNHHCVAGCVQDLSTADRDYLKNGFFPASRNEETTMSRHAGRDPDRDRGRDDRGQRRDRRQGGPRTSCARATARSPISRSRRAREGKRSTAVR